MYRYVITLAILLSCTLAASEMDLKVMSFNVRYGTAMDGDNAWPHRKDILVNTIKKYAPDIIGVQECLAFQADYIVEKLPEYRWFGVDRDVSGKGEMTAILYQHARFFPIETSHFWLSEMPEVPASKSWDTSLTRMASWARFHSPETNTWFHFYNTHLDHRGAEARAQGVAVIADHIATLPEASPVILTGDFNAYAQNSRPYEVAMEKGLLDAWTTAKERVGSKQTFSSFKDPEPDKDARIDWILYRGSITVFQCETVLYNENGRYPSDHFPIHATLHIK